MTTDCEHCLRPNRQIKQQCDKQNDHYLNPKRVLHAEEIASKVFFFRLAFKAVAGPDLKVVNAGAYEYFVMQVCTGKEYQSYQSYSAVLETSAGRYFFSV